MYVVEISSSCSGQEGEAAPRPAGDFSGASNRSRGVFSLQASRGRTQDPNIPTAPAGHTPLPVQRSVHLNLRSYVYSMYTTVWSYLLQPKLEWIHSKGSRIVYIFEWSFMPLDCRKPFLQMDGIWGLFCKWNGRKRQTVLCATDGERRNPSYLVKETGSLAFRCVEIWIGTGFSVKCTMMLL